MLRITPEIDALGDTRLVLEGRIVGAWVAELRRVAASCRPASGRIVLDLAAVSFADADGLELLRGLLAGTARLGRASSVVSALLGGAP